MCLRLQCSTSLFIFLLVATDVGATRKVVSDKQMIEAKDTAEGTAHSSQLAEVQLTARSSQLTAHSSHSSNLTGVNLVVVTDPRTDPTEDDATALCALVALNKQNPFADKITALVTGAQGTLDARYRGIEFLKDHGLIIETAPALDYSSRFWAPYGDKEEAELLYNSAGSREKKAEWEKMPDDCKSEMPVGESTLFRRMFRRRHIATKECFRRKHIVDRIPDDTTALMVIGQVEADFFEVLTKHRTRLAELEEVSLQGPGFNMMSQAPNIKPCESQVAADDMLQRPEMSQSPACCLHPKVPASKPGLPPKDPPSKPTCAIDTGAYIKEFIDAYGGLKVVFSDAKSNLMISSEDNKARFAALSSRGLNPDIQAKKELCVVSFWATAGKFDQFEGQMGDFKGYNYKEHTAGLLESLTQSEDIKTLTGNVKDAKAFLKRAALVKDPDVKDPNIKDADVSAKVLEFLKASWDGWLYHHFKENTGDRAKVVAEVQNQCSIQGSRTYDELNAIEFALRHQSNNEQLVKLRISSTLGAKAKGRLPGFLGGMMMPDDLGDWSGTYISMPAPIDRSGMIYTLTSELTSARLRKEDGSDRQDLCHPFHEYTVDLIKSLESPQQ